MRIFTFQEVPSEIYPSYCGSLNGSAGEFFPPNREKTFVDFFTPDLCRCSLLLCLFNEYLIQKYGKAFPKVYLILVSSKIHLIHRIFLQTQETIHSFE
jgi:hypothetical protein